jgi:uncharacterized membrane protein
VQSESSQEAREATSALPHLYRGEVGRMVAYRVRLDSTTRWSIGTTAAVLTFGLGGIGVPHWVFPLATFLHCMFAWIEARRFRSYELIRRRVRLLESGYYATVLDRPAILDWREQLANGLREPKEPISFAQALSVRLRRCHLWLIAVAQIGWLVKLDLEGGWPQAAGIGEIPGYVIMSSVAFGFVVLFWLSLLYRPREQG